MKPEAIRECPCGSGVESRYVLIEDREPEGERACPKCIAQKILDHVPFLPANELRIRFDNSDGAFDERMGATVR